MSKREDGGPAFPVVAGNEVYGTGISLRDYFAGQALANSELCPGQAPEYDLRAWFGERGGITRFEVAAAQAYRAADALLSERKREG